MIRAASGSPPSTKSPCHPKSCTLSPILITPTFTHPTSHHPFRTCWFRYHIAPHGNRPKYCRTAACHGAVAVAVSCQHPDRLPEATNPKAADSGGSWGSGSGASAAQKHPDRHDFAEREGAGQPRGRKVAASHGWEESGEGHERIGGWRLEWGWVGRIVGVEISPMRERSRTASCSAEGVYGKTVRVSNEFVLVAQAVTKWDLRAPNMCCSIRYAVLLCGKERRRSGMCPEVQERLRHPADDVTAN